MSSNGSNSDGFPPQPDLPTVDTSFFDSTRLSESGHIGEEPQPQPNSVINRDQIRFLFKDFLQQSGFTLSQQQETGPSAIDEVEASDTDHDVHSEQQVEAKGIEFTGGHGCYSGGYCRK